jgi:WD40 repeat protein
MLMTQNIDIPTSEPSFPVSGMVPGLVRIFGEPRFHTDGDVLGLAFSPEGVLYSVEEPGVLRRWNPATGRPQETHFLSDLETLWAFGGDARLLASASDDLSLWDVATGQMLTSVAQPSWVTAITINADSSLLATGHDDGIVRLWDIGSRRLLRELQAHELPLGALAFSADGQRLAAAGEDRSISIWDVASGGRLGMLQGHTDHIQALAWHPDGHLLVSAAWDRTARVWDTATFEPLILLNSHADQVTALAYSPDGNWLASADSAQAIHVWDPKAGKDLRILTGHEDEVRCLAFSGDGQLLASGGNDRVIRLWDPHEGQLVSDRGRPVLPRTHLVLSPDGGRLASTCGGASLRVWDTATGQAVAFPAAENQVQVLAGSPDGQWLAIGGEDNRVSLWNAAGQLLKVLEGQAGRVAALAFSPDSRVLASASAADGTVWLWDVTTGEPILVIPLATDACTVETLVFHPQQRILVAGGLDWLATGGSDGAICLWDVEQRNEVATFSRGTTGLAFHPSGRFLAATSLGNWVSIWDLATKELARELTGHTAPVSALAYSPDGRWLVSGSDDRSVRFWDATTGELAAVHALDSPVKALAFSPDGRFLYTGNGNTTSYQLDVQALLEEDKGNDSR